LNAKQHLRGRLKDPTGAPFKFSKVVLRKSDSNGTFAEFRTVNTDEDGRFDFQTVHRGKYRFLPAPNRGWKQPEKALCQGGRECELDLTLEINPTDQPFAGCPIQ
jgi:hypothetical protein